jgi:hypothetical protein
MLTIALINKKKSPSELLDQSVRIMSRGDHLRYDMIGYKRTARGSFSQVSSGLIFPLEMN